VAGATVQHASAIASAGPHTSNAATNMVPSGLAPGMVPSTLLGSVPGTLSAGLANTAIPIKSQLDPAQQVWTWQGSLSVSNEVSC
jgi:hypothetical protein